MLDPAAALDRWLGDDGRGESNSSGLIHLRRDLHRHPELSGEEHRTTAVVADALDAAGLVITPLPSGTGLVADLPALDGSTTSPSGGRFAVRADLDALAMTDEKDVPYRSLRDGVCHACGHDVHTTIAVGAATFLAEHRELAPHGVRFIFQPAEERVPGGAVDTIAAGTLDGVDTIVAFHCEPKADVGQIGLRSGPITSAADMLSVSLIGPGGHTARPELTVDTIGLAGRVVTELPRLVSARADSDVKLVFGAIHGGDAANAIPTRVEIGGSVRTASATAWEHLETIVDTSIADVLQGSGAAVHLEYTRGVPPVVNDHDVIDLLRTAATTVVGAESIYETPQSWGGDDFAWYLRHVRGAYVRLGVHDPSMPGRLDLHAGRFDVDERSIDVGVRCLATAAHLHSRVVAAGIPA